MTISAKDVANDSGASTPPHPAAQRVLRTPRSVSSLQVPNRRAAPPPASGVPSVRATSPGAERREAQKLAEARKEIEEKRQRALQFSPLHASTPEPKGSTSSTEPATPDEGPASGARTPSSNRPSSLRRFQITRSSGSGLGGLRGLGGVQKRRDGTTPGVAILMEQLQRPLSRQASAISDLVSQAEMERESDSNVEEKPRKRPVVNKAEKQWREQRQAAIAAAKSHINETMEKSAQAHQTTWDDESERLAKEFERVALEIEHDNEAEDRRGMRKPEPTHPHYTSSPQKPLKYQPKPPKQRKAPAAQLHSVEPKAESKDDSDGDFVYDVYIRRPISEMGMLANPLAELESENHLKSIQAANSGIGVIVITAEDEEYWENFVEGDEEEWDSEDADSNGMLTTCDLSDETFC